MTDREMSAQGSFEKNKTAIVTQIVEIETESALDGIALKHPLLQLQQQLLQEQWQQPLSILARSLPGPTMLFLDPIVKAAQDMDIPLHQHLIQRIRWISKLSRKL